MFESKALIVMLGVFFLNNRQWKILVFLIREWGA